MAHQLRHADFGNLALEGTAKSARLRQWRVVDGEDGRVPDSLHGEAGAHVVQIDGRDQALVDLVVAQHNPFFAYVEALIAEMIEGL